MMEPEDIPAELLTQMQWFSIRQKRDQLICDTDFTQLVDSPLPQELIDRFKIYRDTLRNIPQSYAQPDDVVWPEKPTI
ncbi:phage tail assembly chaperone [Vibrio splendidus]|nr:phage tail assembly chaperone [Vibrio splendidus]